MELRDFGDFLDARLAPRPTPLTLTLTAFVTLAVALFARLMDAVLVLEEVQ